MTVFLDDAVGETRLVRVRNGLPDILRVERWSESGTRARVGETHAVRVRAAADALGGAFVTLGTGEDGFLRFRKGGKIQTVVEGEALIADVVAEAAGGKGPVLRRGPGRVEGEVPRLLVEVASLAEEAERLAGGEAVVAGAPARAAADAAVEEALETVVGLPRGGSIAIEPTRALTAVDVDSEGRRSSPAKLAVETNIAAAETLARHLALRSLAGLVAIDFISMNLEASGKAVHAAFLRALDAHGLQADALPLSRFGVCEVAISRTRRPIAEALTGPDGADTIETAALKSLRALEREAEADRGARLVLRVAPPVAAWLRDDPIGWRPALTGRLGARFEVETGERLLPGAWETAKR